MAAITRLTLDGYGGQRAGSFAGREEVAAVTRKHSGLLLDVGRLMRPGIILFILLFS